MTPKYWPPGAMNISSTQILFYNSILQKQELLWEIFDSRAKNQNISDDPEYLAMAENKGMFNNQNIRDMLTWQSDLLQELLWPKHLEQQDK
jgi:hypothetical protein